VFRRLLMAFCPNCGTQIPEGATVCPKCGTAITSTGATSTGGGLADNMAGALAYLFIPAIVFLVVEPYNKNRFVRFHSFQDLFFAAATIVLFIALMVISAVLAIIPILGHIVALLLWVALDLGIFVVWIVLLLKAYQGKTFKLPVIGDMAEKQANTV
jgi:uncharacterized membrane protein